MEKEEEEGIEKSVTEKPGREIWARQSYIRVPTQDTHDKAIQQSQGPRGQEVDLWKVLVTNTNQ